MDTIELLAKFSDPEVIKTLSLMDRMIAGLITTFLGMGITFIALVVLQFMIVIMAKFSSASPRKEKATPVAVPGGSLSQSGGGDDVAGDEEIVAAVTAAIALQLKTSVSNIVIRNIEKIEAPSSAWHNAGIAEQMNNSL